VNFDGIVVFRKFLNFFYPFVNLKLSIVDLLELVRIIIMSSSSSRTKETSSSSRAVVLPNNDDDILNQITNLAAGGELELPPFIPLTKLKASKIYMITKIVRHFQGQAGAPFTSVHVYLDHVLRTSLPGNLFKFINLEIVRVPILILFN